MKFRVLMICTITALVSCASVTTDFADLDRMADESYNALYTEAFIDSVITVISPRIDDMNRMDKVKFISSYIHDSLNVSYIDVPFDSIAPYYGFLSELVQERKGNCMAFTTLYHILLNNFNVDNYALTFPKHILLTFPYKGKDYFIETTSGIIHNSTDYLLSDTLKPDKWDNVPLSNNEFESLYRYNVALELTKSNDFGNIFTLMKTAYSNYSEPFYIADLYAYSAFQMGDYETSAEVYRVLEKTNRKTRMNLNAVYINWGNEMADNSDYLGALNMYKKAMNFLPGDQIAEDNFIAVSNNYAVSLTKQGLYDDAVDVLNDADELRDDHLINNAFVYVYNSWGNYYFNIDDYEMAIEKYADGLKYNDDTQLTSNIVSALVNWGNDLIVRKKYKEARGKFTYILEFDPYNIYAYRGLANIAFNAKEYRNAGDYFKQGIEYGDNSSNSYYSAGVSYFNAKEYRKAKEILNMGLSKFDDKSFIDKAKKILDMMK